MTQRTEWTEIYRMEWQGARRDRMRQLIFEVRNPDKTPGYDARRAAEELANLLEDVLNA